MRIVNILLAVSGGAEAQVMADNVGLMQGVVNTLNSILHVLSNDENERYGYHAPVQFSGGRGRPRIVLTREMLLYFLDHGFLASTSAQLLHISLRTVRRRMSDFGVLIRIQYSDISDHDLDEIVTSIQRQYPNCGYRMMQGHLNGLNHRVQQGRVREAMARTDPEGLASRWCNTVVRRAYPVPSPNSLWHVDGNHRLIRY